MMKYGLKDDVLRQFGEIFSKYDHVAEVLLYGSMATDDHKYNSDIDLCLRAVRT